MYFKWKHKISLKISMKPDATSKRKQEDDNFNNKFFWNKIFLPLQSQFNKKTPGWRNW